MEKHCITVLDWGGWFVKMRCILSSSKMMDSTFGVEVMFGYMNFGFSGEFWKRILVRKRRVTSIGPASLLEGQN